MPEITTLWNQIESFADMSEEWNPFEEDGLKFLQENKEPGRYPRHVVINGVIGYMIMPGIYYFGNDPEVTVLYARGICCARKSAIIGYNTSYGLSFEIGVKYLAIDEENIPILKKMQRSMGCNCFVVEYQAYVKPVIEPTCIEDIFHIYEDLPKKCRENASAQRLVGSTAEELMPGIGISHIRVGLKYVFLPRIEVKEYEYAYKSGDMLVLIAFANDAQSDDDRVRQHDLRMLEELTIRRTEFLRCGLPIERDYYVIDCKEQKEKQVLAPEAYDLFQMCKKG